MHPVGVILTLGFLGEMVVVGIVLFWFGYRSLWGKVHIGNPIMLAGIAGISLRSLQIALGALLCVYGILGIFRVVWGG